MSYIHDALKVSSRQRTVQQSGVSEIPTSEPVRMQMKLAWRYGVLILLLLALGGWFWASNSIAPEIVPVQTETNAKPGVQTARLSTADSTSLKGVAIQLQGTPDSVRSPAVGSNVVKPEQRPSIADEQRQAAEAAKPPVSVERVNPYDELPYLRQLPAAQQRELQGIDFTVHIYSEDPASRMVKLNGKVVRELDFIRPGLRVVEIIPRAVVLQYQDQRFKVPAL